MHGEDGRNARAEHWTGTFQRLRAETVILALLLLATTQLDISLTKLPILGLEFTKPAPKTPILVLMYLFFFYFVAAWIARYRRELHVLVLAEARLSELIRSIEHSAAQAREFSLPSTSELAHLISRLEATSNDFLRGAIKPFSDRLNEVFTPTGEIKASQNYDEGMMLGRFEASAGQLKEHLWGVERSFEEAVAMIKGNQDRLVSEISEKGPALQSSLAHLTTELTLGRKEVRKLRSSLTWDMGILGFYVPLIFFVVIVIYTLCSHAC